MIRVLVSKCDNYKDCNVTSMTSYSHATSQMTSLMVAPWAFSYRHPIGHKPLNRLVSEIYSIEVADTQTHR